MIRFLARFAQEFLYDERAFQRYITAGLFALGALLVNGGAIPGTGVVVPGLANWSGFGAPLMVLSQFIGSGGKMPASDVVSEATGQSPPTQGALTKSSSAG